MSNTSDSGSPSWDSEVSYVGCVKWFNNKAGYGFLTVMDGDKQGEDVFCHHSGVVVTSEQYKYLVQGEYVSFSLRESDSDSHPYQAGNITGVCNGKLMCETRAENRQSRDGAEENGESEEYRPRRGARRSRPRGGGPREDGATWMLVRTDEGGKRRTNQRSRRPRESRD
jgi:cold shock CspA family protein